MGRPGYHHGDLKSAILDAAEQVLAEKSLDAISMRDLARKAGVSSGAPYYHFRDRSGLVSGLCQRGFSRLGDALNRGLDRDGMRGMIDAYLVFSKQHESLYQLMFSAEATEGQRAADLNPYAAPVFRLLQNAIESESGPQRNLQDQRSPVAVWCFMHGFASLRMASPLRARLSEKDETGFAHDTIKRLLALPQ